MITEPSLVGTIILRSVPLVAGKTRPSRIRSDSKRVCTNLYPLAGKALGILLKRILSSDEPSALL